ncbi:SREBP protease/CBS domain [Candidatus Sumerlaea chitinivorans]|uniref:Zinc metalloprotease n=1 Tax=Sumerlaea chitinivorans TaxID=2250252 RepID=A0A2Z4Y9S9_SUMC1|nr:SREBP protease/CBS domain [Candidatus Sumerlaea chitinivorans]
MRWSWKIGRFAGIDVFIHVTFVALIAFIAIQHFLLTYDLRAVIEGTLFPLLIFGCVLLHEFGHALAARRYGIRTRDITLYPIGGVARLERMPDKPHQELWVALAGPLVNVAIAVVLYLYLALTGTFEPTGKLGVTAGPLLERLLAVNVMLVGFNLLPAFPMDGGRVLRALLASRMDYVRATNIAATLGQAMAMLFGFLGIMGGNPILVFIAFFVWIAASQEASMAQIKGALGGIPVWRAMITDFRTVTPDETLADVAELIIAGSQPDFPVVEGNSIVGVLTRADLLQALATLGKDARVRDVMRREFMTLDPGEMLELAFARLNECACHTVPVVRNGRLIGLITPENIGEFLMIQSALSGKASPDFPADLGMLQQR